MSFLFSLSFLPGFILKQKQILADHPHKGIDSLVFAPVWHIFILICINICTFVHFRQISWLPWIHAYQKSGSSSHEIYSQMHTQNNIYHNSDQRKDHCFPVLYAILPSSSVCNKPCVQLKLCFWRSGIFSRKEGSRVKLSFRLYMYPPWIIMPLIPVFTASLSQLDGRLKNLLNGYAS